MVTYNTSKQLRGRRPLSRSVESLSVSVGVVVESSLGMASMGMASVGMASVGMGSVGSVRSVRLMRLRMGLVGVRVGEVRSVLSLVLGVVGVGVVHGLLVRRDNCCLCFSKDAAVNYRCGT